MKKILLLCMIVSCLIPCGCDDDGCTFVSCDSGPFFGKLNVRVAISEENPTVEVVIYEGYYENGDTVLHESISESNQVFELETGRYYSGTAVYFDGGTQIIVINGKDFITSSDDCGCEYGGRTNLNLRLARN